MPTYNTFPTTVPGPSYPVSKKVEPKIKRVEFGDGYTQESGDGINFMLFTWDLTWETLSEAEKTTIEQFLYLRKGYETFLWTDTDGIEYRVKAASWEIVESDPGIFSIRTTFKQAPI